MPSSRIIITSSLLLALGACAAPHPARPTAAWESAFIRSDGWTGADGAATIPLPNNRVLWLFGDSWIGPVVNGRHMPGSAMVNNTIAVGPQRAAAPSADELHFHWGTANGKPAAWCVPEQPERWFWPASGGIVAPGPDGRDRLVIFMTRLSRVDASDSMWNFRGRGTSIVTVSNPADPPEQWRQSQAVINEFPEKGPQIGWGFAVLRDSRTPDGLLIYGIDTTSNFDRQIVLATAPAATIENVRTWQYWTANGWSRTPIDLEVLAHNVGPEVSVFELGGRYAMVYSHPFLGPDILARTAPDPLGPWSEAKVIFTCPEPAQDRRMMVYSAKAHPELSGPDALLISYSVNSNEFADVVEHADRYRPRFIHMNRRALENP